MTSVGLPSRVAILGFARSGRALAGALLDRGVEVSVGDAKAESELGDVSAFKNRGARFSFGGPDPGFSDGAAWIALSPGVPPDAPAVARARRGGARILSEIEIAWRIAEAEAPGGNRWVAITGTNGKSTTTAWIADILRCAGRPVALAGNIGVPLSAFLSEKTSRDFVCEVSSFQLETIERFRPDVAVLTNITPDHLDRYADMDSYARAKRRIFENQRAGDFAVINEDDSGSRGVEVKARRVAFSRRAVPPGGTGVSESFLVSDVSGVSRRILPREDLSLPGEHNLENALAAVAATACLETPESAIAEGLRSFQGLPHRTQLVAESAGVRWVNDSKGTNVDATKKSLVGYPEGSVLLILGGRDKHGDFPALAREVARAARLVFTVGEAAEPVERALAGAVPFERAGTIARAVARAAEIARPGDTVLLSPACASFDQYGNFEERGDDFARLARRATAGLGTRDSGLER